MAKYKNYLIMSRDKETRKKIRAVTSLGLCTEVYARTQLLMMQSTMPEVDLYLDQIYNLPVEEDLTQYEIWSEGYNITGDSSGPANHGKEKGKTFTDACTRRFMGDPSYRIEDGIPTYWGCRLYQSDPSPSRL